MKNTLIILVLFFASISVYGQEGTFKSKIILKDGSILHVTIIENNPGKYIKILLPGDTEATIDYANILSIKHKNYSYRPEFLFKKGLNFNTSSSLLFGRQNEYSSRIGLVLGFTANYRFFSMFNVGIGVDPSVITGYLLLPVYLHLSGDFRKERVSPIYFLDAGWSFAKSNNNNFGDVGTDGGWFVRPGVGLRFNKVSVSMSYQIQEVTTTTIIPNFGIGNDQETVEVRVMKNVLIGFTYYF